MDSITSRIPGAHLGTQFSALSRGNRGTGAIIARKSSRPSQPMPSSGAALLSGFSGVPNFGSVANPTSKNNANLKSTAVYRVPIQTVWPGQYHLMFHVDQTGHKKRFSTQVFNVTQTLDSINGMLETAPRSKYEADDYLLGFFAPRPERRPIVTFIGVADTFLDPKSNGAAVARRGATMTATTFGSTPVARYWGGGGVGGKQLWIAFHWNGDDNREIVASSLTCQASGNAQQIFDEKFGRREYVAILIGRWKVAYRNGRDHCCVESISTYDVEGKDSWSLGYPEIQVAFPNTILYNSNEGRELDMLFP